jgi:hypothetical protein
MANLVISDGGAVIPISFEEMLKYHGPGYPGGVAHAFKVLERAFALLSPDSPPERREIRIDTAFGGPGGRDAFEMVTRAVTEGRFRVDGSLAPPGTLESPGGRYFFRVSYRDTSVDLVLRPGLVRDEFVALARRGASTVEEEEQLARMKQEMADRLMSLPADEVYEPVAVPAA